jgi:glycosyltransferase 2 family protein
LQNSRSWLVGLIVSLVALAIAFWGVRPARVVEVLAGVKAIFLLPAALMIVLGLFARARSWFVLLGERAPYGRVFWALNEGYLLNNVLPLRLGELGRAYSVSQSSPVTGGAALATVVIERLIDVAVSLAGLALAISAMAAPVWAGQVLQAAGVALAILVLAAAVLALNQRNILRLVDRLPGQGWLKVLRTMDDFARGLGEAARPARLLRSGFWSLGAWVTAWISLELMLAAFGTSAPPMTLIFVTGVTAFGAALPSSPGAVGVYELSTVAALLVFGVSQEVAVSLAVLAHALSLVTTGALGAIGLAREGRTILGLAGQAQKFFRRSQETLVA